MSKRTCLVEGCEREVFSGGACGMHYQRKRATGEYGPPHSFYSRNRLPGSRRKPCRVEGCKRPAAAKGACKMHYYRKRRTGEYGPPDPIQARNRSTLERIMAKVEKRGGCWLWRGSVVRGEPRITVMTDGKQYRMGVRRIAYEELRDPLPKRIHVYNACGNPLCINPDHTHIGRGPNAKLTPTDVEAIRQRRRKGARVAALASEYGVSQTTIYTAASGVTYQKWRNG